VHLQKAKEQNIQYHQFTTDNQVLTDHAEMAEATYSHFDALLGTAVAREHILDLHHLIETQGVFVLLRPGQPLATKACSIP
jgi:hypothetical protein